MRGARGKRYEIRYPTGRVVGQWRSRRAALDHLDAMERGGDLAGRLYDRTTGAQLSPPAPAPDPRVVWMPPADPVRHPHDLPDMFRVPMGTVARCSICGATFRLGAVGPRAGRRWNPERLGG